MSEMFDTGGALAADGEPCAGAATGAGVSSAGEGAGAGGALVPGEVLDFRKPQHVCQREAGVLTRTVFFVGFMGAGKTSTARKLARYTGVASVDMDRFIERRYGAPVKDILAEAGEDGFRRMETDLLRELAAGDPCIVSCGGGVVVRPESRAVLRDGGFVVYLQVSAEEAASRISDFSSRPLFGDLAHAREVNRARRPLYEEVADAVVDTAGRTTGSIAREVASLLRKKGVLITE